MISTSLFEHETIGPFFTWSNKQTSNPICSNIDRALVNTEWITSFPNSEAEMLNPHIFDHSPLRIKMDYNQHTKRTKHRFKFLNYIADHPEYLHNLRTNWKHQETGSHMYHFWKNLQSLQYKLKGLTWQMTEGIRKLKDSRLQVEKAQTLLANDHLNLTLCQNVKF